MAKKTYKYIVGILVAIIVAMVTCWFITKGISYYKSSQLTKGWTEMGDTLQSYANRKMIMSGSIIDDKGNPLDKVTVKIKKSKSYITPFAMGDKKEVETLVVNSNFKLEYQGYHNITIEFARDGYFPVTEKLTTISIHANESDDVREERIKENSKIILREVGSLAKSLKKGNIYISKEPQYDKTIRKTGWVYRARECEKHGIYERVNNMPYEDPSEVDIYGRRADDGSGIRLIANVPDTGFTKPLTAKDFTYLPEAPENGYRSEIKIPYLPADPDDPDRRRSNEHFCYLKLREGLYGKMRVVAEEFQNGESYRLTCTYYLNPDGSRNLRSLDKR